MINITEIVALLPKQADLETAILSGQRSAVPPISFSNPNPRLAAARPNRGQVRSNDLF
jgi:hypothetical protein